MKILIYNSGGGIGDSIQLFDIILTLKNNFSKDEIYYLSAHDNHFNQKLLDFNLKVKPLITEIKYFGLKLSFGSNPNWDFGKSLTWPIDAITT